MFICKYVNMYICIYVYMCMFMNEYVNIYIYMCSYLQHSVYDGMVKSFGSSDEPWNFHGAPKRVPLVVLAPRC